MHSFLSDCQKHEKAKSHMESYKTWKTFNVSSHESVDVLFSRARREAVERYNEGVRQNREMLKNLTEAVLYLARQELAFREHDESTSSLNKGNYRELLQSFCKLDSVFDRRLNGRLEATEMPDTGGVFTVVSSDVQNDLIECLDDVIQDEIDKEISDCQFISIQCDETLDISFCTFSKPSSDRKAHFNAHGVDIPSPGETRWYYKSTAVKAIIEGLMRSR